MCTDAYVYVTPCTDAVRTRGSMCHEIHGSVCMHPFMACTCMHPFEPQALNARRAQACSPQCMRVHSACSQCIRRRPASADLRYAASVLTAAGGLAAPATAALRCCVTTAPLGWTLSKTLDATSLPSFSPSTLLEGKWTPAYKRLSEDSCAASEREL